LKEKPDAVVLLDEIEKAHPDVFKKFLTAWNDGHVTEASTGQQVSTTRAIFVLTSNIATDVLTEIADRLFDDPDRMRAESVEALRQAGFAPEVLNRLDRIFVFRALKGLDIARVSALEIEAMIESYGLKVETGGIDPVLLIDVMRRQSKMGDSASARDLVRAIEDMISESLIVARQQGAKMVSVIKEGDSVVAKVSHDDGHAASARLK
jgi:ATP-dependent Clp protease ATP-binding subunit ClpA